MHDPVNRAPYSYHGEYSAIFTMVNCMSLADVQPLFWVIFFGSQEVAHRFTHEVS